MRSYNKKLVKKRKGNAATASGGAQGGAGAGAATNALDRGEKFSAALKAEAEVCGVARHGMWGCGGVCGWGVKFRFCVCVDYLFVLGLSCHPTYMRMHARA